MRSVSPDLYDKNYFLNVCAGSEEFKKSHGKKLLPRLEKLLRQIQTDGSTRILDIGCGRGDISLYLAKNAGEVTGIDYSKEAIDLANSVKKTFPPSVYGKVNFQVMNVKKLSFPDNYFDVVICIDVLEHLYREEAEKALSEIKRVLKKNGILFLQTDVNRLLYDYAYKYYIFPVNKILTKLDQLVRRVSYESLPRDPRTIDEKTQHVNEPTYFYLKKLFSKFDFKGKIKTEIGYIRPVKSFKTVIYNSIIAFYPLSAIYPLNIIFGWVFVCKLKNIK
jgi:ubiquinone/menaquinone biosynthesis C-methylase UbiE